MASGALLGAFRSHRSTFSSPISRIVRCMSSEDSPVSRKFAARKAANAALKQLSQSQMAEESRFIADKLHTTGLVHDAKRMAIYVHCPKLREIDTTPVLVEALERPGARVYAPRVQDKDANMHFLHITSFDELEEVPPFGIREPTTTYADGSDREDVNEIDSPLDIVVMPGLAFDDTGRRLGRGGGYYDKFIEKCYERAQERGWMPPLLVAIAYRAQIMEDIPCDEHDKPVDLLVTADGVKYCSERGKELEKSIGKH